MAAESSSTTTTTTMPLGARLAHAGSGVLRGRRLRPEARLQEAGPLGSLLAHAGSALRGGGSRARLQEEVAPEPAICSQLMLRAEGQVGVAFAVRGGADRVTQAALLPPRSASRAPNLCAGPGVRAQRGGAVKAKQLAQPVA